MEWFLHGRNRGPRFASRSRHPKRPGLLRQPCHRGLKSANPPAPPVPRPTGTAPAPTTWKLPMSFVPYKTSPVAHSILSRDPIAERETVIGRASNEKPLDVIPLSAGNLDTRVRSGFGTLLKADQRTKLRRKAICPTRSRNFHFG